MSIKDYLKTSWLLLCREKKKLIYSIVTFLCCIVSIGILLFNNNINTLLNRSLSNVVGYRTIITWPKEFSGTSEKDITDLSNIEHVIDVYDGKYRETIIRETNFANDILDGTITLLRGEKDNLPNIVAGRGFEEGETGVALCPTLFFPTSDTPLINSKYLIDGNTILGKTFTIQYHSYIENEKSGKLIENETFSKEFKIVGLYEISERFNNNGCCYVPTEDLTEIVDTQTSYETQDQSTNSKVKISTRSSLDVVVDNVYNVDTTIEKIESLGFETSGLGARIDTEYINTIRIFIILVLSITLLTIFIIIRSYVKKMMDREEKNISILRISGYYSKSICSIYALKLFFNNFIIYIVGILIVLILFFTLKNNIPYLIEADLIMGGIDLYVFPFIFAFFVIVIFPTIVVFYNVFTKCKNKIINLIRNVE